MKPVLQEVARILAAKSPSITLVYQSTGSCAGADAVINETPVTATAKFWDAANGFAETECSLPSSGASADIGISDVYAESCNLDLGAGQKDFLGPVQVMTMVTPIASSENSISAEAAYLVFGFGGDNHAVAPWDNDDFLYIRADSSGTKAMIARAIGLPSSKWRGQVQSGSGAVNSAVVASAQPDKTIGILAADWADQQRDKLKILAYQHGGQSCGYYPDSTANTFDKINVREGRYAIWGSVHFITNVDSSGTPVPAKGNPAGANVAETIRLFTHDDLDAAEQESIIRAEAAAYTVPLCAMKVTRDREIGDPIPFEPATPCGCFFESLKGAVSDGCSECETNSDCGGSTPVCRYGYCEAR